MPVTAKRRTRPLSTSMSQLDHSEGSPPRIRADITLDWPTWAQTAYRSWYIGEPFTEPPRIRV